MLLQFPQQQSFPVLILLLGQQGQQGQQLLQKFLATLCLKKPSSSSKRRKLAAPAAPQLPQLLGPEPGTAEPTPSGTQEQEGGQEELVFQLQEADDSPDITVKNMKSSNMGQINVFVARGI